MKMSKLNLPKYYDFYISLVFKENKNSNKTLFLIKCSANCDPPMLI